jgi:putative hydrolase of the HAD superfamily
MPTFANGHQGRRLPKCLCHSRMALDLQFEFFYPTEPRISVRVRSPETGRSLITAALLDTGADISLFDDRIAARLGIESVTRSPISIVGVGGGHIDATLSDVELVPLDEEDLQVAVRVAFAPAQIVGPGNLLGLDVLALLDFWAVTRQPYGIPRTQTMIRAVIFDIGGPLDLEEAFEAAIDADVRAALAREGFQFSEASWQEANRRAVDTFAPSLYRSVIWQLTGGDLEKSLRVYHWMQERGDARRDLFELRPGITDVLAALKARGLRLGLAANQALPALENLARNNIGHYFENKGISAVYGYRKPDIRLFLRACQDLAVKPAECIMVGDRIDNDIVPARLLGRRTVLIRTGRHREQQARSWDELPDAQAVDAAGILRAIETMLDNTQSPRREHVSLDQVT